MTRTIHHTLSARLPDGVSSFEMTAHWRRKIILVDSYDLDCTTGTVVFWGIVHGTEAERCFKSVDLNDGKDGRRTLTGLQLHPRLVAVIAERMQLYRRSQDE